MDDGFSWGEKPTEAGQEPAKFLAKKNCKTCYGRGFIVRTQPIKGKKKMTKHKTLCHCATEINTPEPDK